ncbi:MAG: hypothetical protein ACD_28C00221G0001, partial [uncultured bacterium]
MITRLKQQIPSGDLGGLPDGIYKNPMTGVVSKVSISLWAFTCHQIYIFR